MASQQPNAWQTTNRSRNSTSRTPNRSGTQSPSQQAAPTQAPRPAQANNVWTQRSSIVGTSNGPAKPDASPQLDESVQSVNGFNASEVKDFLSRDVGAVAAYKLPDVPGAPLRTNSRVGAVGNMANNHPFFAQLAKQVATVEGGG